MKYLLTVLLALILGITVQAQEYTRNGKEFSKVSATQKSDTDKDTGFTYRDSKGNVYPIYISGTGSCYIKRISQKTGKEYKSYLGAEVSSQICSELGIENQMKPIKNLIDKR